MSLETLVQQHPITSESGSALSSTFDADSFDAVVMSTYGRFPLALARGAGCRVWDTQGREYLDFVAGIATCTLGHAHPAMVEAVTRQMQKLHHVSNLYYIPEQGELAKWIVEHSCGDRVFFCNSGAEANEAAIKLARKYAHSVLQIERPIILTTHSSFHGRTLATITATGQPKYQKNFDPLVPGFHYVPYNDIAAVEAAISELDEGDYRVAAILIEPLQGEGGVRPGDVDYFQKLRQICDVTGVLLIFDEVQVGMGRSGKLWGYEYLGVEPDIFTSAKGLGGGVPIGAMISKKFCDVFQPGEHASTFGGNSLACGVALTVCQTLETENILQNVQQRGEQLRTGLKVLASKYPNHIVDVRGWGLISGMELKADIELTAGDVVKAAINEGLLLVPAGPKVIRFVPPLIVSEKEVETALQIVDRVMASVTAL
ncbi:aspartate aminotransferase family protein [Fischerella sp. JS2]|uniref:aspartate aminotransferase family protein n=1 Tax=Fischerella sp. JS2 TaxID=2597771 RepID=UPI0028E34C13|nr:aspartate aminotransferase family protein [Fischerella sp. JS2]